MALIKCKECGKEFSDMAAACPNCGYSPALEQKKAVEKSLVSEEQRKSKITAGFLCLFLWSLGGHELYLGNIGKAMLWLIVGNLLTVVAFVLPFLWILLLVPIICAVKIWTMPTDKFDIKYNQVTSPKGKLGCLFGVIIGGIVLFVILCAIAWPQYQKAVERARAEAISGQY